MSQQDLDSLPSSFWKLCEIEGIKRDRNPLQEAQQKKSVEVFMQHGYSKIESLEYFPNITELIIIQQDIQRIENLSCLVNLESLWINDNPHLTTIEGLHDLKQLKKLFLFDLYHFLSNYSLSFFST